MPVNPIKNLIYQGLLPFRAPSPKGQITHLTEGIPMNHLVKYEQMICQHHVLGASLLLKDGEKTSATYTSTMQKPVHRADSDTLFRVASITKVATAIVLLTMVEDGIFSLDTPINNLLPKADMSALEGITLAHLLSHTSGLRDIPAYDQAVQNGGTYLEVLADPNVRQSQPGAAFAYCNFGFGLLGCVMEYATNQPVSEIFRERLFEPLGMRATLNATELDRDQIMPITRVLPYQEGQDTVITKLGSQPLTEADPLRHFGHTAGAMYTDAVSLSRMLSMIANHGTLDDVTLLSSESIRQMVREHSAYGPASPTLHYGLGLLFIEDRKLSKHRLIGHQGYAYGCADGAFYEEGTGRQIIFLNGGCSEAREGRLGLCNRDMLRFALQEEIPSWK